MVESSILSAQRQAYGIPRNAEKSNIHISQHTLKELMMISNRILSKWKQSTPNIEKSLQDLTQTIASIHRLIKKLDQSDDNNLLQKYQPQHYQKHIKSVRQNDHKRISHSTHNLNHTNTQQADQGMRVPAKRINQLTRSVYDHITGTNSQTLSKHSVNNTYAQPKVRVDQHSLSFQGMAEDIPTNNSLDIKFQTHNTILGNSKVSPDVIPNIIDLLMISQLGRIGSYDKQLLSSYELIQARNNLLSETQDILSQIRGAKPVGSATAVMPMTAIDFMIKKGLAAPAPTDKLTENQFGNYIESVNNLLTQYNSESQIELVKLQRVISYRNQSFEIMSNTISRIIRSRDNIIGNIR